VLYYYFILPYNECSFPEAEKNEEFCGSEAILTTLVKELEETKKRGETVNFLSSPLVEQ